MNKKYEAIIFISNYNFMNIMYFMKNYLEDEILRHKIENKIFDIIETVYTQPKYKRINILAHGFGAIIGIDMLANYHLFPYNKYIRFITLGSRFGFLKYRASWLNDKLKACQDNKLIKSWIDFSCKQDWLCAKTLSKNHGVKIINKSISNHDSFFIQNLKPVSSNIYFEKAKIINEILN